PAGAVLSGAVTAPTNGSGTASFTDLAISGPVGSYSLRFTAPSEPSITGVGSSSIALSAGPAGQLKFTAQPRDTTAGATMSPVQVTVQDAFGNTVTSPRRTVTVEIGNNP